MNSAAFPSGSPYRYDESALPPFLSVMPPRFGFMFLQARCCPDRGFQQTETPLTEIQMLPRQASWDQIRYALSNSGLTAGLTQEVQAKGIMDATRVVVRAAKARVPVESGTLKRSIRAARKSVKYQAHGIKVTAGVKGLIVTGEKTKRTGADMVVTGTKRNRRTPIYGLFLEKGTGKMKAKPYLEPAQATTGTQQLSAFAGGCVKGWNDYGKRLKAGKLTKRQEKLLNLGF